MVPPEEITPSPPAYRDTFHFRERISPLLSKETVSKPCVVFGIGRKIDEFLRVLKERGIETEFLVDNKSEKVGTEICGLQVHAPTVESLTGKMVLIASLPGYNDIAEQLRDMGLREGKDFRSLFREPFPEELAGGWRDANAEDLREIRGTKWIRREEQVRRAWDYLHRYLFEYLYEDKPLELLDCGCGTGATLAVVRYFGHRGTGLDYSPGANEGEWFFKPLIEREGLDVVNHDGSDRPYPFEDHAFDVITSIWSIRKFAEPSNWGEAMDEFARLSRSGILVIPALSHLYLEGGQAALEEWSSPHFERVTEGVESDIFLFKRT